MALDVKKVRKAAKAFKPMTQVDAFPEGTRPGPINFKDLSSRVAYHSGMLAGIIERIDVIDKRVNQLTVDFERLRHALGKSTVPPPVREWALSEFHRLEGEIHLMLVGDKRIDWETLAQIHRTSVEDVRAKAEARGLLKEHLNGG